MKLIKALTVILLHYLKASLRCVMNRTNESKLYTKIHIWFINNPYYF